MKPKMYEMHCSKCNSDWMIQCETIVHAQSERMLKDKILEGGFFTRKCSECGELITMYYPFLYCDMKQKYLIALSKLDSKWVQKMNELDEYKDFKKRVVLDEIHLQEKIRIFDAGLEDETIELIKERMKNMYHTLVFEALENDCLWFRSEKGPIGVEMRFYQPFHTNTKEFIYI